VQRPEVNTNTSQSRPTCATWFAENDAEGVAFEYEVLE
jgi:hypothetical protein